MPGTGGVAFGKPFERFRDRLRLTGQVDDQRLAADHRHLPRQDRRRHEAQRDLAHLFAEAGHFLVGHGQRGLGRHVARRRAGAAGGEHEVAAGVVDQFAQRRADLRGLVGDQPRLPLHRVAQRALQPVAQRGQPLVFVDAARGAVADRHQADAHRIEFAHGVAPPSTNGLTNWNSARQPRPWRCPACVGRVACAPRAPGCAIAAGRCAG